MSSYYEEEASNPEREANEAATLLADGMRPPPLSPTTTCSLMARLSLSTPGSLPPVVALAEGLRLPARLEDERLAMACAVFGHEAGECVGPGPGTNEFLSALVALSALAPYLDLFHLLAVTVMIEATIPFRPHTYLEELRANIEAWAPPALRRRLLAPPTERLGLALGLESVHVESSGCDTLGAMLAAGARLAARDVGNFAEPDARIFLINAWRLLPENCPVLRAGFAEAALADVRGALAGTIAFYAFLPPDRVFHPCPGGIDDAMHSALTLAAARNLAVGRTYVGAALVAAATAEALARLSGGDAPGLAAVLEAETTDLAACNADVEIAALAVNMDCPRALATAPPADIARTLLAIGRHGQQGPVPQPVAERGDHLGADAMPLAAHVAQRLHEADMEAEAVAAIRMADAVSHMGSASGAASPCGTPPVSRRATGGPAFSRDSFAMNSTEATDAAVAAARRFHAGELTADALLAAVPQAIVKTVAQLLGAKDPARVPALARFAERRHCPLLQRLRASATSSDMGYSSQSLSPTTEDDLPTPAGPRSPLAVASAARDAAPQALGAR